ncbi:STN domain-containing protein [Brevundimonas sp. NPDC090276]|uniref:STN domain-containing protein n=1 Tax=Brevundimonas sp. NPDC090276 TaxID=3363956 RepID=UPI00383AFB4E
MRNRYLAGLVLCLAGVLVPIAACAADDALRRFEVVAQPLDQALAAFSISTGLQMLYDSSLAAGRRSSPVAGEMQPREALALMLAGTGLTARFTSGGAVVIYAGSTSAVTLNPITATAAPVVGRSRASAEARAYAEAVQRQTIEALRQDAVLSGGDYALSMRLWVNEDGVARRVEVLNGSGQAGRDADFLALTSTLRFPAPPPDLPQPMRIEFRVRQRH